MNTTRQSVEKVKSTVKRVRTRWQTVSHLACVAIFCLVLVLLLARWMAPYAVQRYVNRTLNRHPEYGGRIGQVHLHLIRGAYSIEHVDIQKKNGKVPVPFLSAKTVDLSVAWHDLFHGSLVSEIKVDQVRLNFVQGPTAAQSQTGIQKSWVGIPNDLFPFKINRCVVRESEVWFHDFHSDPQVHVYKTNLVLTATNLTKSARICGSSQENRGTGGPVPLRSNTSWSWVMERLKLNSCALPRVLLLSKSVRVWFNGRMRASQA